MKRYFHLLLIALTLMLTMIPAAVFANEDGGVDNWPISIEFSAPNGIHYYEGTNEYVDEYGEINSPSNTLTINFNDSTSKTYKYVEDKGWFLDGRERGDEIYIDWRTEGDSVIIEYIGWDKDREETSLLTTVKASVEPYPTSLKYEGAELTYTAGRWDVYDNFYKVGNKIIETYSDGRKNEYICVSYNDGKETTTDYFLGGDTTKEIEKEDDGSTYTRYPYREWFDLKIPENGIKAGTQKITLSKNYYYGGEDRKVETDVAVKEKARPVSATFKGKVNPVYIGEKEIGMGILSNKGNIITVTYSDKTTATFKFITFKKGKDTYNGFYKDGNKNKEELWGSAKVKNGIKKGSNKLNYSLSIWGNDFYFDDIVMKNVVVKASKIYAYTVEQHYVYSGKVIKPKIVVKDGKGKTLPAKYYTVTYYKPKTKKFVKKQFGKAYGVYEYRVKFKKAYKKKYISEIWGWYSISTKPATIKSASGAKEKFTAKWKKAKKADGYIVQYSKTKNFKEYYYGNEFGKNATSGTINGVEKGTYYVRVVAFKKVKSPYGGYDYATAKPSGVKKVIVK